MLEFGHPDKKHKEVWEVAEWEDKEVHLKHYSVIVGSHGVMLTPSFNENTLGGMSLIKGRATKIESRTLADRIAKDVDGKLIAVLNSHTRTITEL